MKKIFLSLGFNGKPETIIMDEINRAKQEISSKFPDEEQIEFVHNYEYEGSNRVECLGEAIKKMATCDFVYFINEWYEHKGCLIEMQVCNLYQINHTSIIV